MKKIAIYSRKSKFTGKGDSIGNQVDICKDYIGKTIDDDDVEITVFEDEGISAKDLNRPQFKAMMKAEETVPFNYIVAYRLDRISRNVCDFSGLMDKLNKLGTAFISVSENFDTSTPMGRAMMNIAAVFAQLERETIAERIKDNMYLLAQDGHWNGGTTPFGFNSIKQEYVDGSKIRSYYTLHPNDDMEIVKLIFKKYRELHSINAVENYMNETQNYTRNGNHWVKSNIKRILTNPVYCIADEDSYNYFIELGCKICFDINDCNGEYGILPYGRFAGQKRELASPENWVIAISAHKGLLSGKEWVKIQHILADNATNCFGGIPATRRTVNPISILSGVLRCKCGAYMRPKRYGSGNYYYICEEKLKKADNCSTDNVPLDIIDNIVLDEIFNYNIDGNSINRQFSEMRKRIKNLEDDLRAEIKCLEKKKSEKAKAIQNLIQNLSSGALNEFALQAINNQMNTLQQEITEIDKKISELQEKDKIKKEMNDNVAETEKAIEYLKKNFDEIAIMNKRDFIKKIIDEVIWDSETVHIFIHGSTD